MAEVYASQDLRTQIELFALVLSIKPVLTKDNIDTRPKRHIVYYTVHLRCLSPGQQLEEDPPSPMTAHDESEI